MKKISFFVLAFVLLMPITFAQETVTITTYYPSPYGVYKQIRLYPTDDIDPNQPCTIKGEMYYDDSESQAYICDGSKWTKLGGLDEPEWIAGAVMSGPLEEFKPGLINYFNNSKSYTPYYDVNNWNIVGGSQDFSEHRPRILKLSLRGDLTAGQYKIEYGGGNLSFTTGSKYRVTLYVTRTGWSSWHPIDQYELINPAATDSTKCNFSDGSVEIPVREASIFLYNNWNLFLIVRVQPMYEALDWDMEIGTPSLNVGKIEWDNAISPSGDDIGPAFDSGGIHACSPDMKSNLCGPNAHPNVDVESYYDYNRSYYYMKVLNGWGGATVSNINIDIYKMD